MGSPVRIPGSQQREDPRAASTVLTPDAQSLWDFGLGQSLDSLTPLWEALPQILPLGAVQGESRPQPPAHSKLWADVEEGRQDWV